MTTALHCLAWNNNNLPNCSPTTYPDLKFYTALNTNCLPQFSLPTATAGNINHLPQLVVLLCTEHQSPSLTARHKLPEIPITFFDTSLFTGQNNNHIPQIPTLHCSLFTAIHLNC
ncbi:unnamed protein product [Meganyctiphanes norvegica]|uniref:Uncharacterized protein n=1 Tax=Meganyctiphanes norvegica TaxID=48144 RepID=A0AAV2R635_MEGNR